jgi:hypothetical protein
VTDLPKHRLNRLALQSFGELDVTVGTNCPQGGDAGHGGRTVFRLDYDDCLWSKVRVCTDKPCPYGTWSDWIEPAQGIEIVFMGDAEADVFLTALEYAAAMLRAQMSPTPTPSQETVQKHFEEEWNGRSYGASDDAPETTSDDAMIDLVGRDTR